MSTSKIQSYLADMISQLETEQVLQFSSENYSIKLDRDNDLRDFIIDQYFEFEYNLSENSQMLLTDVFWCADWCQLGDLIDSLVKDGGFNMREAQEIDIEDLECAANFYDRVVSTEYFGLDKQYQGPQNGLCVGDSVVFNPPHKQYTPNKVKGFSLNGLYCYFGVTTSDNEQYIFTACSVNGQFVFLPHYTLVKV